MPEPLAGPRIEVTPAGAFNYAAWLNHVPLFDQLRIDNTDGSELAQVTVKFEAKPPFARPRDWPIDRIRAGEVYTLNDPQVEIDPDFMERLNEADRGQLLFRLVRGDEELCSACHELRVLARDEWGGTSTMAELLPAFVTPNEAAISELLRDTAEILANSSQPIPLAGYQSDNPQRVWRQTAALWSAIVQRDIAYSNPPSSFERTGQKIRRASQILEAKLATCLDLAVLFASALEAIGLNPVLVLQEEHAFVGVWLRRKTFELPLEDECGELRKALQAEELIVFETTLATHRGGVSFPTAQATASESLSEWNEHRFEVAVDVKRSRMAKIQPLASRDAARLRSTDESSERDAAPRVPEIPPAPEFKQLDQAARPSWLEPIEPMPRTPKERIENWQRKLLDLTLRNRLLNYRATQQTVPIACVELSRVEDRLANGASLELKHQDELASARKAGDPRTADYGDRDRSGGGASGGGSSGGGGSGGGGGAGAGGPGNAGAGSLGLEQERELTKLALERGSLLCALGRDELFKRLTTLRRKVANDQAEGGANTLYLAIGFLRWRESLDDPRTFRAPLLLLPVQLSQRAARASFRLSKTDDEPRFNATLVEKLKRDLGVDLSTLVNSLPADENGVDVPRLLDMVRYAVRDLRGVEVVEETVLASFSFAKYLMWKDLSERVGTLERNRVVGHLVNQQGQAFRDLPNAPMPAARELDQRYRPEQIVHPLPADSSQLAAVMAAADGRDFVIVGPPGTGKSQTIANLIAQCLAHGKTVLFVAEKAAALNVVYRRLREHGLDDRCVELHSHKTGRKHFLEQLKRAWLSRGPIDLSDWNEAVREVGTRRDILNAFAAALHDQADNGWTPVQALGEASLRQELAAPKLEWPRGTRHTAAEYGQLRDAIQRLATAYSALPDGAPIPLVLKREWSMAWESELLLGCRKLTEAARQLQAAHAPFAQLCDLPYRVDIPLALHSSWTQLAGLLANLDPRSRELLKGAEWETVSDRIQQRESWLAAQAESQGRMLEAMSGLTAAIAGATGALDNARLAALDGLALELTQATASLPPDALVLHANLEAFADALAKRPYLLQRIEKSTAALRERGFSPALIERIPVEQLEIEWRQAHSAVWPLALLRKQQLKGKLKAYMQPGGTPVLEVDLPLLAEYRLAGQQLEENLAALGLPPSAWPWIDQNPRAFDQPLAAARRLREWIRAAGGSPEHAGHRNAGSLQPIVDAARQVAIARDRLQSIDKSLADDLATLRLSAEIKALILADLAGFKQVLKGVVSIHESLATLTASGSATPAMKPPGREPMAAVAAMASPDDCSSRLACGAATGRDDSERAAPFAAIRGAGLPKGYGTVHRGLEQIQGGRGRFSSAPQVDGDRHGCSQPSRVCRAQQDVVASHHRMECGATSSRTAWTGAIRTGVEGAGHRAPGSDQPIRARIRPLVVAANHRRTIAVARISTAKPRTDDRRIPRLGCAGAAKRTAPCAAKSVGSTARDGVGDAGNRAVRAAAANQ